MRPSEDAFRRELIAYQQQQRDLLRALHSAVRLSTMARDAADHADGTVLQMLAVLKTLEDRLGVEISVGRRDR